jgi:hypothetical protein
VKVLIGPRISDNSHLMNQVFSLMCSMALNPAEIPQ